MRGIAQGSREWAKRIAARVESGQFVERYPITLAAEVLGRPILRGGKHAQRPDVKDKQAGDRHDDMVPL